MPKLTKTFIDNIKPSEKGDAWFWDSELEGFGVRVQGARKVYVIRYRTRDAKRTQRKLTICRCTDMPPEKARELARKEFAKIAEGMDPTAERKPAVAEANNKTVERMFEGYVASLRAKSKVSVGEVERALLRSAKNAADALGRNTPAADVTPTDIVNYVSKFFHDGRRGAADKHRGYISAAYNWAMKSANDYTVPVDKRTDFGLVRNPAADVAKDHGAGKTRDRNLSAPELRALWLATAHDQIGFFPETAACIRMLICCGQRVRETLRIEGKEIDLENALWRMPPEKSKTGKKTGKGHVIPLPRQAVEELARLIEFHGDGPLFPARGGAKGELLHDLSVMQAIRRWTARDDVSVEPFQTRDLRRTWKSRAHDAGVDRFTRDLIQQHAKNDTGSKHYDMAPDLSGAVFIQGALCRSKTWRRISSCASGRRTTLAGRTSRRALARMMPAMARPSAKSAGKKCPPSGGHGASNCACRARRPRKLLRRFCVVDPAPYSFVGGDAGVTLADGLVAVESDPENSFRSRSVKFGAR